MSIRLHDPLPTGEITDRFGWRPGIPSIGLPAQFHNGLDKAAPHGTPILAAHAGTVRWSGWDTHGGGWMIQIGAAFGSTLYGHMSEQSPLPLGRAVRPGDVIGYVGSTGAATGPHLHLILRLPGGEVDPLPYLTATPKGTDMTPQESRWLKSVHDAIFSGGNSMQDDKKSISQSLADLNAPVRRGGKLVPVKQDNADTNTIVRTILTRLDRIEKRIGALE